MICVADSGSTKTDWVVKTNREDQGQTFKTIGLNPFFASAKLVEQTVLEARPESIAKEVEAVHFYGAGCSSPTRNEVIKRGLVDVFPNATIYVYHDLLGAARACCQREEGIASILGTGSNSCHYDGEKIVDNVTNLGFILGDEGSGGHIGKQLIRAHSYREMPADLQEDFDRTYKYDHEEMLQAIYSNPLPNRYLASFAPFCSKHRQHPFTQHLLHEVFDAFVRKHLVKYRVPDIEHHFLGSVAYEFKEELALIMREHGLKMGKVIPKPIELLSSYHLDEHGL